MSDQLAAAAEAMKVPQAIVERSARAWASATGSTFEEVLAGWAGGTAVATSTPAPAEAPAPAEQAPAPETGPESAPEPAAPALPEEAPAPVLVPVALVEEEPEPTVEALWLGERLRLAGRVGALTGLVLGFIGLVLASTWLLSAASLAGQEGSYTPAVEVSTTAFLIGTTLISVVFGIVVAVLSRGAAGWIEPGARLQGRSAVTISLGAGLGLVLGVAAGAILTSAFAEPIEGAEGMATMGIIPTAIVVLLGGAFLGWVTALLVQVVGVPAGIDEAQAEEIADVRSRLGAAIRIPLTAAAILALLVLPLGITFIRSNEMASGGAALLALLAAASVLGFAAMAASRPNMGISFGEFLVALAGIGTVVLIIFAVIQARSEGSHAGDGENAMGPGGTVTVVAEPNISFDSTAWSVPSGEVTLVYKDGGDVVHTLTVEGHEDDIELRVQQAGDIDQGTVTLAPGTYTLYCTIKGHREAGMEGTLTVTAGDAAA